MRPILFAVVAVLLATSCEKESPALHDYLCGNDITWYNPNHREVIIEVDTCNTTFYFYPCDSVVITSAADPLGQCYHDMPYRAYIMIDSRKWVFWQKGYIMDANTIE